MPLDLKERARAEFQRLTNESANAARSGHDWTPNTIDLVIKQFLKSEPSWLGETIRRDPALVHNGDKDLIKPGEPVPEAIVKTATPELNLYQGLHAIAFHRLAHTKYKEYLRLKAEAEPLTGNARQSRRDVASEALVDARAISQGVRRLTAGIEIHPGAEIGENFFIDHGAGVVIGETAKIGNNVFLYHDVTLGAYGNLRVGDRRHPIIGNGSTLSAGSKVLGAATLGDNNSVGADALLIGKIITGKNVRISSGAMIKGDARIDDDVRIHENVHIIGNVHIGEGAIIEPGVTLTEDVPPHTRVSSPKPELVLTQIEHQGALTSLVRER